MSDILNFNTEYVVSRVKDMVKIPGEYFEKVKDALPENVKELLLEIAEISLYISLFLIFSKDNKKTTSINYKNYMIFAVVGGTVSFLLKNDRDISRVIKTSILGTAASQAMINNL